MRLYRFTIVFLLIAVALVLMSCALVAGPEKDVILKITARRIAFHGFEVKPDLFIILGDVAKEACERITNQDAALEVAFTIIVERISKEIDDPLLAQDIKDIVELLGIDFDAAYTLAGLTPEKMKYISIFVCAFAQGVEMVPADKK